MSLKSQFLLFGNVHDLYPYQVGDGKALILPIIPFVGMALREIGIAHVLRFDPVRGFSVPPAPGIDAAASTQFLTRYGLPQPPPSDHNASLPDLVETLTRIAGAPEAVATFVSFSSRLLMRADQLTETEHALFTRAFVHGHGAQPRATQSSNQPLFNPLFWLVEKEGDLPDWFVVNNPSLRPIPVPAPDHLLRRSVCETLAGTARVPTSQERVSRKHRAVGAGCIS